MIPDRQWFEQITQALITARRIADALERLADVFDQNNTINTDPAQPEVQGVQVED